MQLTPVVLALCLALAATSGQAAADETLAAPLVGISAELSLNDVYVAALGGDPRSGIAEASRQEAAALAARADSLLAGAPALVVRHQTDQAGTDRGLREWEANLELPLWRWGQRAASRNQALSTGELAGAQGQALRLEVAGRVRDVLWSLALAEEQRHLAEQAWHTAQALEQDVQRRVEAGDLAEADLLLARDETLARQDEYLLAVSEVRTAEKRYLLLSGLPQRPAEFSEVQSARRRIEADHPLLLEAQRRVEQAQAELQRARASGSDNPMLIVGTRRDQEPVTETTHDSIGVSLRLPFGGGAHAGPAIAAANNQLVQAQSEQLALQRELELALHDAQQALTTLRSELELARQQHQMAQENLRMARLAFDLGEIDLVQRLRVQTRADAAERTLNMRKLQVQQAIARYNQVVGETL
ncbi:TolC family protein [Sulfurivermis fontis]|uniref:TolC family protein n=1 Tax=Sulfurivermis fontis TaxID=1972068 RepID=UPI000FD7B7D2|nr:TolC family protein [Sulfurivermis fontis]